MLLFFDSISIFYIRDIYYIYIFVSIAINGFYQVLERHNRCSPPLIHITSGTGSTKMGQSLVGYNRPFHQVVPNTCYWGLLQIKPVDSRHKWNRQNQNGSKPDRTREVILSGVLEQSAVGPVTGDCSRSYRSSYPPFDSRSGMDRTKTGQSPVPRDVFPSSGTYRFCRDCSRS
jgi:hypothetical protein